MHILVVGGAGYIGSVTVDQLIDAGHDLRVTRILLGRVNAALHERAEGGGRGAHEK